VSRSRRQFIHGRWISPTAFAATPEGTVEIASFLLQVRPDRLAAAEAAIAAIPGAEVFQRDPRGKLVVVLEAEDGALIGETLTRLSLMPEVLSASLVYHAIDSARPASQETAAS